MRFVLEFLKSEKGFVPVILKVQDGCQFEKYFQASPPLVVTTKDHRENQGYYREIHSKDKKILARGVLNTEDGSKYNFEDNWICLDQDTVKMERTVEVEKVGKSEGFRCTFRLATAFSVGALFLDFEYLVAPAFYKHTDLDRDGVPDYLKTYNLTFREDRLTAPAVMGYHSKSGFYVSLIRADLPQYDSIPNRNNSERFFIQETDVGSLGFWTKDQKDPDKLPQVMLRADFPFYEGERSFALLNKKRSDWGAFWPNKVGNPVKVSYWLRIKEAPSFIDACWDLYTYLIGRLGPVPPSLPFSWKEMIKYRVNCLDRYYVEKSKNIDPNEPAGFILNCRPQDGKTLSRIIQYGFTGQNILNAYIYLRYGYDEDQRKYIQKARKIIDFFSNRVQLPNGLSYNLYNVDKKKMDFWWVGLLLPLNYAESNESLRRLMGPILDYLAPVVRTLKKVKGCYLRCMGEETYSLLLCYEIEKAHDIQHDNWMDSAIRFGNLLLELQDSDGSWHRAYSLQKKKLTKPEIWFGTNDHERKSASATPIPFLLKLCQLSGEKKYLESAINAGKFVLEEYVNTAEFCGGIHDSMYTKGVLIDNEGILYPMLALLMLYRITGEEKFKIGAIKAAKVFCTWIYIWDVPLPEDSTLYKFGFRSTGMGACDNCGAGYVHPFQLLVVHELLEIAKISRDEAFFTMAELIQFGEQQTLATPSKMWGYKYEGMQEEGYLVSWLLADDPVFKDTKFGHRWKGEGNKTCFPWIPAVALYGSIKILDSYGTLNFDKIYEQIFSRVRRKS